jgi:hypothetical protein
VSCDLFILFFYTSVEEHEHSFVNTRPVCKRQHNIVLILSAVLRLLGNMNVDQAWIPLADANVLPPPTKGQGRPFSPLMSFSSTCYYFGESLSDGLGKDAPPIGLIHTVGVSA